MTNFDSSLSHRFFADKLQEHWRGLVRPAETLLRYDLVLVDTDGSTAALVRVMIPDDLMQHHIEHRLPVAYETVRWLRQAARERRCLALIMVVCNDDDFLLDLRDESGITVKQISHDQNCLMYSGSRFLPLFTLPSLL